VGELWASATVRRWLGFLGPALGILVLQRLFFPVPAGVYVFGAILGLLNALVAVGMALVYRANRILNFAQSDLGMAPSTLAANLIVFTGLPYLVGLATGLAAAVVLGVVIELLIIRRFFRASRLVLTVVTIGLSQLLVVGSWLLFIAWDQPPRAHQIDVPFTLEFTVAPIIFHADSIVALVIAPVVLLGIAGFLRYTSVGIAVRASAERADRASLLGVPVQRLQTVVWAVAALLSFVGIFLRAGIVGLPVVSALTFSALLLALAALMMGRLTNLPAITASAIALGVLEQGVIWNNPRSPELVFPVVAAVVVVTLLLRRRSTSRVELDSASSWQTADEVRAVPFELRRVGEVRAVTWIGGGVLALIAVTVPIWLREVFDRGDGDVRKATAVAVLALITLSVVVLTGWAGQVSLGQMSFAAFGGAVGAVVTDSWGLDLGIALVASGVVGAAVAVAVGLPALRLRGLFLAVTTLAFALATHQYLLNPRHFDWVPREGTRFDRPTLLGAIDLQAERSMYWFCLATLAVAMMAVRGIRRSRTGRVLLAQRENERAAQAYGVNLTRAKLTAFALSGFLAAVAGCLFVQLQQAYTPALFAPSESLNVFTSAVVGGLGSLAGAVLGALVLQGGQWFLPPAWRLLPSAAGVLVVLMLLPGGLAGLVYRVRDLWLRSVARRRAIIVPSLVADVRPDDEPVERAEERVEEVEAAALAGAGPRPSDGSDDRDATVAAPGSTSR
jgi:branched-chain amino acid transport system permease protein